MESFEQLAEQYQPMIHKIISSLHIYKNKDEFYQDSLIALWKARQRFDPEKGSFTNYAYTYIKGTLLMGLRNSSKEEERKICPKEEFWELLEDPSVSIRRIVSDRLGDFDCQNLTENQRKWLYYTVHYGLSIKEIADQENVSLSAVKGWRAGARAKLQGRK
ncbi:sigma-70 family RNA polymerase sigma factor [Neobacillus kokaensis]|uniref:RNA polymerase sigma-70 region 2 domain-containing protein n=1 Tax=Neobacillus kokaensis TaxID=2759023 RepID=A0ABQ3N821_9BACI|nr:sigma-70 family RNA polymerase sigma factor [Neobacillus kokaensis]GHI00006.1 hypothetical protein AM1BK_35480 [Neobacillus kokaensis]